MSGRPFLSKKKSKPNYRFLNHPVNLHECVVEHILRMQGLVSLEYLMVQFGCTQKGRKRKPNNVQILKISFLPYRDPMYRPLVQFYPL
mmetsp:Transcript_29634/g.39544  ORF Transcript_29634/g.39544 Transcript_29634/m.39544 type:complete len:88 (+) Transcript_29634:648-911(+)